ncbi:hypothetical protein [Plantactinospora sp. KLBMP9567]|uniref:hypothetical protein n=1 Tax=Plantactinospora sp. KLBMP9567 TaxID=3085900 RepID=UPI002982593A|nr:hypothetical protein [Plantactinospora sp. KLBMP9567]MDW5329925.1 hypothetical protein [Plantactinospora sp. KLBMP9567]
MPEPTVELDRIDWSSLIDSYGRPAVEVPHLLRSVWSADPQVRRSAYEQLIGRLVHQGSSCPAALAAVPFLIDLVADSQAPDRFAACQVLTAVAIGDETGWLTDSPDPVAMRREVARTAVLSVAELERERAAWAAAGRTEHERRMRAIAVAGDDVEARRAEAQQELAAYDAVRVGVPVYAAALQSPFLAVRLYAAHLLAWFPEEREIAVPALTRLIVEEQKPVVAATACLSASLCASPDDRLLIDALTARRTDGDRMVCSAAVIGLARVVSHPDRGLIEDLYESLLDTAEPEPLLPFQDGDLSAMAAFAARHLGGDSAQDRVDVIAKRLEARRDLDPLTQVRALLDAAFPSGPIPDGTAFEDLASWQHRAVLAVWQSRALDGGPMVSMTLGRFNLPTTKNELRVWCGLPR